MQQAEVVKLLDALRSQENSVRQEAETLYQQAKQSQPDNLLIGMMQVLGNAQIDESVRRQDAVLLRGLVNSFHEKDFAFGRASPANKQQIATELLTRFEQEPLPKLQRKIGEVVSKLAEHVCDKTEPNAPLDPGTEGWPALLPLVFRMANAATNPNADSCESALLLLKNVVHISKDEIVDAKAELGQTIQAALAHSSLGVKTAGVLLIFELVEETSKTAWAPLLQTVSAIVQVMHQLEAANLDAQLQECMKACIQVATVEPEFFRPSLTQSLEPARFFAGLAKKRDTEDSGLRNLALEWLVSYVEKRTKWTLKNLPAFPPLIVEVCMELMLEIGDSEAELATWAARMDDEEGEEDVDEAYHLGEEALDRVAEAVQMEALGASLFTLIDRYGRQDPWQAKHAALAAIKQTIEYVEEHSQVDMMVNFVLQHMEHPHPRVRCTAVHALGQLANDQSPYFQEKWHAKVMPEFLKKFDDPVDRVASMAMSAFVNFGEDLDNSFMQTYAQAFMEKLVGKLQTSKHRGVQEESITSIAVIAGVIEKDFSQYYDGIMPMLKHLLMHATGEKESRLRGKAFECMSLLGLAVGKERFLPDAREAVAEMMKVPVDAEDVQREYIKLASERICQCLKKDFAIFLPALLPGILKTLAIEDDAPQKAGVDDEDDDDDGEYVALTTGEGKVVKVRTTKFEEISQSVQLLHTFCSELGGAYFDFVRPTAEAILPLLTAGDDFGLMCEDASGVALQVWALLIKCALEGAKERGQPMDVARELFKTSVQSCFAAMEEIEDAEMLSDKACGMTECIKSVGQGVLGPEEVAELARRIFTKIDESSERSEEAEKGKQENKSSQAALPDHLRNEDDDDDEDMEEEEEETCRRNFEEMLGALMQVAPAEFMPCVPECARRMGQWLAVQKYRVLALYLACDMVDKLKEQSESAWPVFMPEVFKTLSNLKSDPDEITAATYCVNLAAPLPNFAAATPEAFRSVANIIASLKPKKRDNKGKLVLENAVASLLSLAKEKIALCPPEVQPWPLILSNLPLKHDKDEAVKVHEKLVDLVLAEDAGVVSNPGPVLSVLAEVHHVEDICNTATEEKILRVFKAMPQASLQAQASHFSEKQQKKIQKMLLSV